MNPFSQITNTLAGRSAWSMADSETGKPATDDSGTSRVERIRRLLKNTGAAMTDAEIAWEMDEHFPNFGAHLVWLLLKHDIEKGRVRMIRHGLYRWNDEYESAENTAIRAAIKLLKRHGYQVKKP
jgi:hypothetical protein